MKYIELHARIAPFFKDVVHDVEKNYTYLLLPGNK